jgi:hypothetical protein
VPIVVARTRGLPIMGGVGNAAPWNSSIVASQDLLLRTG